jgi:hypothetical protein
MHLPGGFTRVRLFALAHGQGWWEIPTNKIPAELRPLGSRLFLTAPRFTVEAGDQMEEIRDQVHEFEVRALFAADLKSSEHNA